MSTTQTVSTYTHCGLTTFIDVAEFEGWGGTRMSITRRNDSTWATEPTVLNLNPDQVKDLERFFVERVEKREKAAAAAEAEAQHASWHATSDPTETEEDENAEAFGDEVDETDLDNTF